MPVDIFVIHENPEWLAPLATALARRDARLVDWNMAKRSVDLTQTPPVGVFFSRMSASSFSRGNDRVPELTSALFAWLERHGRRVVNGNPALRLELNKAAQYSALQAAGIAVPATHAALGAAAIDRVLTDFGPGPVILKPNRGGKGLGVQGFDNAAAARAAVAAGAISESIDGVTLIQNYIHAPGGIITRAEFIGGRFHYAVEIDATKGFELCPAEVCLVPDETAAPSFTIIDAIDDDLRQRYEAFLAAAGIEIAGIEFIVDEAGQVFTYDINTNTNYNPLAEQVAGRDAAGAVADFLLAQAAALTASNAA